MQPSAAAWGKRGGGAGRRAGCVGAVWSGAGARGGMQLCWGGVGAAWELEPSCVGVAWGAAWGQCGEVKGARGGVELHRGQRANETACGRRGGCVGLHGRGMGASPEVTVERYTYCTCLCISFDACPKLCSHFCAYR